MGILAALFHRSHSNPPPAPRVLSEAEAKWAEIKETIRWCEARRLDLAGLSATDPLGFWVRRSAIYEATAAGMPLERAATAIGFSSAQHWQLVERYFEARYSELVPGPDGAWQVRFVDEFERAAHLAEEQRRRERERRVESKAFEPIQGISIEQFAKASAALFHLGQRASRSEVSEVLEQIGIGPARFGYARRAWLERIAADSSGRLRERFQEAFTQARAELAGSGVHRKEALAEDPVAPAAARRSWVADTEVA